MGVSLDIYRAQIGTFSSNSRHFLNKSCTSQPFSSPSPSWKYRVAVLILFSVVISTSFAINAEISTANIRPISCQSPPGCSSYRTSHNQLLQKFNRLGSPHYQFSGSPVIQDVNFYARYSHGNRRSHGIKIGHINLGSGYLVNGMNTIETIIRGYQPHILGVSETSFKAHHDKNDALIDDYSTFFSKTLNNEGLKCSRITVFTHKDLVVKERSDLMSDSFSSVWLEVGLPRQKKLLVCNLYRDWQYLDQDSNASLATAAQLERWLNFLDQWETAIQEDREIHVLGDTNLDFLKWKDPGQPGYQQGNRLQKLSNAVFDRIYPFGFVQLVSVTTRFWPGQEPSGLDHWYTNRPSKISSIQVINQGASDHRFIFARRSSKSVISKPRIIKKRSYKNFPPQEFLTAIRSISWWEVFCCEDVEKATELFTNKLTKVLDTMAPVKCFQVRKKYAPWLSPNLKSEIENRDKAQQIAQESNCREDWLRFRKLRNSVNNKLRGEKRNWQKNKIK